MQRDHDFIRKMLLDFEASDEFYLVAPLVMNPDPDDEKKHTHAELLCDAGMFEHVNEGVYRMTNHGHDYVEAIRSDTVWNKVKSGTAKAGGQTLDMMFNVAVALVTEQAKKHLGL